MEISLLLQSILLMAVIIAIGSVIGYRQPLTGESRQLIITIIVNVAMPCIILDGVFQTPIDSQTMTQIVIIFGISVLLNCLGILLGWLGARTLPLSDSRSARRCSGQKERFRQPYLMRGWTS